MSADALSPGVGLCQDPVRSLLFFDRQDRSRGEKNPNGKKPHVAAMTTAKPSEILRQLQPELVMVYTIARDTPIDTINKISRNKLNEIASKVRQAGLSVTVSS